MNLLVASAAKTIKGEKGKATVNIIKDLAIMALADGNVEFFRDATAGKSKSTIDYVMRSNGEIREIDKVLTRK